jgi:hypothetical protein
MDDPLPNFDLPPVSEKSGFPWGRIILAVVVIGGAAWWFLSGKSKYQGHDTAVVALEQQLDKDRATLDAERQKAVDMTTQLEAMKQAYALGKVPNKRQAIDDYTKLDAERRAQREKVKTLTAQYNEKLGSLQKLK